MASNTLSLLLLAVFVIPRPSVAMFDLEKEVKNSQGDYVSRTLYDVPGGTILRWYLKGPIRNLNCKALNKNGETISCRHITIFFSKGGLDKKSEDSEEVDYSFESIDTVEKLSACSQIPTDDEFYTNFDCQLALKSYYFDKNCFGLSLKKAIQNQQASGLYRGNYLLYSTIHMMGMCIFISHDQKPIKLAVYDPNDTLRVIWFAFSSIAAAKSLKLKELFVHLKSFKVCFGHSKSRMEEEGVGCFLSLESTDKLEDCHVEVDGEFSPIMFHCLMCHGHFAHQTVRELINKHESKDILSEVLLTAKCTKGFNGASSAIRNRHVKSFSFFAELVLRCELDDKTKAGLLNGEMIKGLTYLSYLTTYPNNVDGVKCFEILLPALLKLTGLDALFLTEVLASKDLSGTPVFWHIMNTGQVDCVEIFMTEVLDSNLGNDNIQTLLSGMSSVWSIKYYKEDHDLVFNLEGDDNKQDNKSITVCNTRTENATSAIYAATDSENYKCAEIYVKKVLDSSLNKESIKTLLSLGGLEVEKLKERITTKEIETDKIISQEIKPVTELYYQTFFAQAINCLAAQFVCFFINQVAQSDKLSEDEKEYILRAKNIFSDSKEVLTKPANEITKYLVRAFKVTIIYCALDESTKRGFYGTR